MTNKVLGKSPLEAHTHAVRRSLALEETWKFIVINESMNGHVTLCGVLLLYGGELLAPCPTPNQCYTCYALRHCLLNIAAVIL